jgi:hypothetical protein
LQSLREMVGLVTRVTASRAVDSADAEKYQRLLKEIQERCLEYGFDHPSELAGYMLKRPPPANYGGMFADLNSLDEMLGGELRKESVFRIPHERAAYYEHEALFGGEVTKAFPSCDRDIQNAGSCYALGQADACVHHLMLVLERGLHALADKVEVPYERASWQTIISRIESKLKGKPPDPEFNFYREVSVEFGFLKDAYRNHSQHAHEPYDLARAFSTLYHVDRFMRELAKGGPSE